MSPTPQLTSFNANEQQFFTFYSHFSFFLVQMLGQLFDSNETHTERNPWSLSLMFAATLFPSHNAMDFGVTWLSRKRRCQILASFERAFKIGQPTPTNIHSQPSNAAPEGYIS